MPQITEALKFTHQLSIYKNGKVIKQIDYISCLKLDSIEVIKRIFDKSFSYEGYFDIMKGILKIFNCLTD